MYNSFDGPAPRPPWETLPTMYDLKIAQEWALELEQKALEQEQRADRLATYLRTLGLDPDQL